MEKMESQKIDLIFIGLLVFVIGVSLTGILLIYQETKSLEKKYEIIELQGRIVGKSESGWHRYDMERFSEVMAERHPEIKWSPLPKYIERK